MEELKTEKQTHTRLFPLILISFVYMAEEQTS